MLTNERLTNTTHEELGGAIHNLHGHHPLREGSAAPGRRPRARALLLLHDALKTRVRLRHPALSGSMAPLLRSAALHAHGSHKLHSKSGSSGVGAAPLI